MFVTHPEPGVTYPASRERFGGLLCYEQTRWLAANITCQNCTASPLHCFTKGARNYTRHSPSAALCFQLNTPIVNISPFTIHTSQHNTEEPHARVFRR